MTSDTVGWIDAGRMSAPMSKRLVDAGHRVLVLEPGEQTRAFATEAGAAGRATLPRSAPKPASSPR